MTTIGSKWLPFEEAREFVRGVGLRNLIEWKEWAGSRKRPADIPSWPMNVYKGKGWVNLGDWLGTGYVRPKDKTYLTFAQARAFARRLGLKSDDEWLAYTKTKAFPNNIPAYPRRYYKDKGWKGINDWLGSKRIVNQKKEYRAFEEARAYVRGLGLNDFSDWLAWARSSERPADIPINARVIYKEKGWISLNDWLGNGRISNWYRVFRPFEEARAYVRSLGLKNCAEFREWIKKPDRPKDIPSAPHLKYKDEGWVDWRDWLGKGRKK